MFTFIFALLFSASSLAEVIEAPAPLIDFAQNPVSLEWKKIDSEHFEIIFPREIENEAQRVTHLLERAYPIVSRSLEVAPKKISLILQNQSTVSNGFVTLAPRRSEWYVTPAVDPEISNTEWLKTLAVHEFRHVVQFQKTRQGFNRFFEILLGEIGQAIGLGISLPPWFLEGDAVGIETALTKGGRGRLPLFERDLRTLLLSGKDFNYDKTHLGSYKDYIPNHYVYGYFYTSFMRNEHGDLFLSRLADRSTETTYNLLTFYNSYEELTGVEFEEFYRSTMKDLVALWKEKLDKISFTPYEVKNLPQKYGWTNYLYPQMLGKNKFLALKKGLSFIPQFVITDGKEEKTIFYPGILQNEYPYKVRNGRFAYVEWEIDPRWGYRDFSRIRVYDLKEKDHVADLRETKGRLAVLDQTGEFILYVNWDKKQNQSIRVSRLDGKEVYRLKYPKERVITSLDWLSHNEIVMVVKNRNDEKEVVKLSLLNREEQSLLEKSLDNIGFLTAYEGRVLVESPLSGIDNIFEVTGGKLKQLTSARFGAYAPSVSRHELVYNDYTVKGMNIVVKKMDWDEEQTSSDSFVPVYEKFARSEAQDEMDKDFFNQENYPVKDYSQFKNSLNFHSWIILAPPLSSIVTLAGISRDLLNKFSLTVGGNYDLNEQEVEGFVSASWSHLYPVFDLRAGYGGRNQDVLLGGTTKIENHWEEGTFEAGMSIPWKRISGRFFQNFTLRAFSKIIKVTNKLSSDLSEVRDGALHSPGADLSYSILSRMSARDLNPAWGFALQGHFEEGKDITGQSQKGSIAAGDARLYLPGLEYHHSFYHQFAYEKQQDDFYQYSSYVMKPRGTRSFFLNEFTKYSANYLFPLFTPDWNLSRYLYFKRISLNLFYDELNGRFRTFNYQAASTGWETLIETHFFRIFIPITLGVRGNYILRGSEKHNYEFFITTLAGTF